MNQRHPSPLALRIAINNAIQEHDQKAADDESLSLQAEYAVRFPNDAIQIIERAITSECARYEALQKKAESQ